MQPFVRSKMTELLELCRMHSVKRLELFGSAASADFRPETSDIDFIVEFLPIERGGLNDVYFDLLEDLERLFGRKVDLVEASAIHNRFFRASVEATKVPIYAAA
jgi:predicted nucleotidyltransferase